MLVALKKSWFGFMQRWLWAWPCKATHGRGNGRMVSRLGLAFWSLQPHSFSPQTVLARANHPASKKENRLNKGFPGYFWSCQHEVPSPKTWCSCHSPVLLGSGAGRAAGCQALGWHIPIALPVLPCRQGIVQGGWRLSFVHRNLQGLSRPTAAPPLAAPSKDTPGYYGCMADLCSAQCNKSALCITVGSLEKHPCPYLSLGRLS